MTNSDASSSSEFVFINCPFDDEYFKTHLFDAMLFTILACGFRPRSALEHSDGAEVRIEKLYKLIGECGLAIHDLSRNEWSEKSPLPRFNMPLELGIWLGAKRFGGTKQKSKACLILDSEKFRYQKFVSDIAGQDPIPHNNDPSEVVRAIRDWLQTIHPDTRLPGGDHYASRFEAFLAVRPKLAEVALLSEEKLTYLDRRNLIGDWLAEAQSIRVESNTSANPSGVGTPTIVQVPKRKRPSK